MAVTGRDRLIIYIVALLFSTHPAFAMSSFSNMLTKSSSHMSASILKVASVPRDLGPSSKKIVQYSTSEKHGTIIISNSNRTLHYVLPGKRAEQYKISTGRDGFTWTGVTNVGRKAEWPDWRPPGEMKKRDPSLPDFVPAGPFNPLGARAVYLFKSNRDTLFRIHGTNNSRTIGEYETSGCFRLSNRDILELYEKVRIGSKVIVND